MYIIVSLVLLCKTHLLDVTASVFILYFGVCNQQYAIESDFIIYNLISTCRL